MVMLVVGAVVAARGAGHTHTAVISKHGVAKVNFINRAPGR
jgi:hypothetical protein